MSSLPLVYQPLNYFVCPLAEEPWRVPLAVEGAVTEFPNLNNILMNAFCLNFTCWLLKLVNFRPGTIVLAKIKWKLKLEGCVFTYYII